MLREELWAELLLCFSLDSGLFFSLSLEFMDTAVFFMHDISLCRDEAEG